MKSNKMKYLHLILYLMSCLIYLSISKKIPLTVKLPNFKENKNYFNNNLLLSGGFSTGITQSYDNDPSNLTNDTWVEFAIDYQDSFINNSNVYNINGVYKLTDYKVNGKDHYESTDSITNNTYHLYWSGKQWVIHTDLNKNINVNNVIAYTKEIKDISDNNHMNLSVWYVKNNSTYDTISASMKLLYEGGYSDYSNQNGDQLSLKHSNKDIILGIPRLLLPYYFAFMLDSMATGLAMPLLPFYVMELKANALQLSLVISSNYIAQMIGCIFMGKISDIYGRRTVLVSCLSASSLSYYCISRATTVKGVALARIISGSFGGLLPIMQSAVADSTISQDRPKYLGRIMATFGLGFVLGPALSAIMSHKFSPREKIKYAGLLPLLGLIISILFAKETKKDAIGYFARSKSIYSKGKTLPIVTKSKVKNSIPVSKEVLLLILNGFLIMFAFGTETIYAIFIKDIFGYGESKLSALLAINGLLMGLFQVFCIKPMISLLGKHATLAIGNILLGIGMLGLAIVRSKALHFTLFGCHIIGYSIADTALVSLLSRYSSTHSQGRDLSLNQAAQACARIFSPLIAGILYEHSKSILDLTTNTNTKLWALLNRLPIGALPFIVGGLCPLFAITIPTLLYLANKEIKTKKTIMKDNVDGDDDLK